MLTFFSYVVLGLAAGAVYSLTAFGTILVYRGSGVVNFASGALATVGVFVFYDLADVGSTPWPVAMVVGSCVSGLLGAATHLLIMKPMRKTSPLTRTMATLGVCPFRGLPCHRSVPDDGCDSPVRIRRSVDFPQPEGPSSAMILPGSMARLVVPTTWMRVPSGCG